MTAEVLMRRLALRPAAIPLFAELTDHGTRPGTLLLESAEPSRTARQRSMLINSSALRLRAWGHNVDITALNENGKGSLDILHAALTSAGYGAALDGDTIRVEVPPTEAVSEAERLVSLSPLGVVREVQRALAPADQHRPEALLIVGLFGYDLVGSFEDLPDPAGGDVGVGAKIPDFELYVADEVIVIDAVAHATTVVATILPGTAAERYRNTASERLAALVALMPQPRPELSAPVVDSGGATVDVDLSDVEFSHIVEACQEHILAGDVFQIVASRTFSVPCAEPLAAFARLAVANPSPYLFYGCFETMILFGSSPESAIRVEGATRQVEISPIAGTRGRGRHADGSIDADIDSRVEAQLRLDAKETAEHMMLVDLARNDVARVSDPSSRHVSDLLSVVRYSQVMHLVSKVEGTLRPGFDALHAYQATMNMGTLTGAPKVRAMQLLRKFERGRRGAYGGAIGYLGADGSMDTAIVIRSAVVSEGTAYVRAGAGIVADSLAAGETKETSRKASAVLRAIAGEDVSVTHADITGEPAAHILVLDNLDSFTYNLVDAFESLGCKVDVYRNTTPVEKLREVIEANDTRLLVLSPGPGAPSAAGNLLPAIRELHDVVPILGICLGHQGLAEAFGGEVSRAGQVVHGQTSTVEHAGHAMFDGLPTHFSVARYHSLVACEVPSVFEVTARTADGLVMAIAHRTKPLFGLQFHPESILTSRGQELLMTLLRLVNDRSHA